MGNDNPVIGAFPTNPMGWFQLMQQFAKPPTPEDFTNRQYLRGAVHGAIAVKVVQRMPEIWDKVGFMFEWAGNVAKSTVDPLIERARKASTDDIGRLAGEYVKNGGNLEALFAAAKTIGAPADGDDNGDAPEEETEKETPVRERA